MPTLNHTFWGGDSVKLNDLEIKAFRGIRNLTLKDFRDVNLLLGNNDAGKLPL